MKKSFFYSIFIILIISVSFSCVPNKIPQSQIKSQDLLDVNEVFKKVNDDIVKALSDNDVKNGGFAVNSIDLTFSTVTSKQLGTEIKLWVISSSVSRTNSKSYNTTFTIAKPQNKIAKSVVGIDHSKLSNYILNSIKAAQTIQPISNLDLTEFVVNVEYSITKSLDGSIGIDLTPIEIGPNASTESTISHTIAITFTKSK